jgi:hypothetical protein
MVIQWFVRVSKRVCLLFVRDVMKSPWVLLGHVLEFRVLKIYFTVVLEVLVTV